jgi:hypothetical protein
MIPRRDMAAGDLPAIVAFDTRAYGRFFAVTETQTFWQLLEVGSS